MRIIAVSHLFPPYHFSGSEIGLLSILKFLKSKGHQVRMIHLDIKETDEYVYEGIEVYGKQFNADQQFDWADIILSQLSFTGNNIMLAKRLNKPIVHFIHNSSANYNEKLRGDLPNNYVVYNCKSNQRKWNFEIPSMILNPPVSFDEYNTGISSINNDYITLINLNENKGIEIFYKIAERMPHLNFLGVKGSYDIQVIKQLPNVTISEPTFNMKEIYQRTKILLMPSKEESWGRTATEAMCSGIPVICSNIEGLKENCDHAGIYIDDRNDIDAWVEQIEKLQRNQTYGIRSKKCMERAKELDSHKQLEELNNFLQRIIQ